jgi:hypothetical protein
MKERRGRGRPPKSTYKNVDNKKGFSFLACAFPRKPRTKTKKERGRLGLRSSTACQLGKKVNYSESGRDEDLSPTLFDHVDYSTDIGIGDFVIPGPIPDFDALFMDETLFVNLFRNIPDFEF